MPGPYCGSSVESKKTHAPDFKPALMFLPFGGRVQPASTPVSLQISANTSASFSWQTEITAHKHAAGQGGLDQGCAVPLGTSIAPWASWVGAIPRLCIHAWSTQHHCHPQKGPLVLECFGICYGNQSWLAPWGAAWHRLTISLAVYATFFKCHDVLCERSCLIREDVVDLPQLLIQRGGSGLRGRVLLRVIHLQVPVYKIALAQTNHFNTKWNKTKVLTPGCMSKQWHFISVLQSTIAPRQASQTNIRPHSSASTAGKSLYSLIKPKVLMMMLP